MPALMTRFVACGMLLSLSFCVLTAALSAADEDNREGTIWSFKATQAKNTKEGQFRVNNHELFKKAKKIGKIDAKGMGKSTLIFEDYDVFKGEIPISRVETKPPVWEGKYKDENGKIWKVRFEVKDR